MVEGGLSCSFPNKQRLHRYFHIFISALPFTIASAVAWRRELADRPFGNVFRLPLTDLQRNFTLETPRPSLSRLYFLIFGKTSRSPLFTLPTRFLIRHRDASKEWNARAYVSSRRCTLQADLRGLPSDTVLLIARGNCANVLGWNRFTALTYCITDGCPASVETLLETAPYCRSLVLWVLVFRS